MLADKEQFKIVEDMLLANGRIERFEKEYGKIKGRMMITTADIPEGMDVTENEGEVPIAFEASFDFYDSVVGLAMYTKEYKAAA